MKEFLQCLLMLLLLLGFFFFFLVMGSKRSRVGCSVVQVCTSKSIISLEHLLF